MNSAEATELVSWLNEYAFHCPREKLFCKEEKNLSHESLEKLIFITNNNLMMMQGLERVNQHVTFHFSMLLDPASHQEAWKVLLQQMIDFIQFKSAMQEKNKQCAEFFKETLKDENLA